jgi:hypothetical protein
MKLDSKYFDSIRIQPRRAANQAQAQERKVESAPAPAKCQWAGCENRGLHRAPKGRDQEGAYYQFCRDHVAAYNKSYNYFAGMSDIEITDYQKASATGHRPTWSVGVNGKDGQAFTGRGTAGVHAEDVADPLEMLRHFRPKRSGMGRAGPEENKPQKRALLKIARKHLSALNLDAHASPEEIRLQFKALVKLHHPDHNGGDRGSEERFREVIDAYNYLKQAGLV